MSKETATRMLDISAFYVMAILKRAQQLQAEGRDVIHMEIGEPDFPTPPGIVAAGIALLQTGEVKYTPAAGLPALRQHIADFYRQQHGVTVAPERIFITPGASGAFLLALGISLNPGEELLMADPCYPCNSNFAALFGAIPRTLPVGADSAYQLTTAQIQAQWRPNSKGVLIASPSNPTGTLIAPDALQAAIATVNSLGGCFYSDEIYHGLTYGQPATTALQYSDAVFVINSFSKYFGMTGWRIGWLVVPEDFVAAAEKLAQNIFIATSTHSQYAALAAFSPDTRAELERRRAELAVRRDFLYTHLLDLGFRIPVKPEGAFYIYADASRFTDDSFQFALDLLEQEAVAITPGKDFGTHNARQHLRFAYTTTTDKMAVAMQRLQQFITKG
ncbi:pyridoxal phosphate-dependent aminotransferase [Methylovulum psychrotolerans]|uniref:pyridoxal phosphate-dependent aminotransferase n=1 Tax=Methylovulum psychrotolerans TaxID=1704499 RepID=UPI001BFF414E|nr:pyridoxal phosphate-dependent aminotransferase [Methylovulum psychrotolerans]MBT9096293.1 pyridoxal phosphate-dependent aminotransferase [Methylovulum psychrotolerans]